MQIDVVLQEAGSDLDFSCFHSMRSQNEVVSLLFQALATVPIKGYRHKLLYHTSGIPERARATSDERARSEEGGGHHDNIVVHPHAKIEIVLSLHSLPFLSILYSIFHS